MSNQYDLLQLLLMGYLFIILCIVFFVLRFMRKRIEEMKIDPVTGLYLKSARSEKEVDDCIATAKRYGKRVAFIYADVDDLKKTNDSFGHSVGTGILVILGKIIRECLRSEDRGYRWTMGDELLLVISIDPGGHDPLIIVRDHVVNRILGEITKTEYVVPIGLSIGCAIMEEGEPKEKAIERAEKEMYRIKRLKGVGR